MVENNGYEYFDEVNKTLKSEHQETEHSKNYKYPDYKYDTELQATEQYVETLPDLQNGPNSLIKGAPVTIEKVGIHNFRLPLKVKTKHGETITVEASVTGTVSLEAHKKGINMSRIMRTYYESHQEVFSFDLLINTLKLYKEKLNSFDAAIIVKFSYPIKQRSLRSDNWGWQYYEVQMETEIKSDGKLKKLIHFDFVYSSACPCSFELSEHARKYRNKATVPHSQRSVARISIEFDEMVWIEDLKDMCLEALKTETQVVVKREDEQAFAELNGSNTKFVEDAVRLMYSVLDSNKNILDFKVIASHQESLHSHDAIAVITKNVPGGFTADISRADLNSMIHNIN